MRPVIVQYVADQNAATGLAGAPGTMERYRLEEALSFINSELHKGFSPLFRDTAPEAMKQYARDNLDVRLDYLQKAFGNKTFVMGEQYTVADPYLFVVLGWGAHVGVDINRWPALKRHNERIGARPHTIEALKAEGRV